MPHVNAFEQIQTKLPTILPRKVSQIALNQIEMKRFESNRNWVEKNKWAELSKYALVRVCEQTGTGIVCSKGKEWEKGGRKQAAIWKGHENKLQGNEQQYLQNQMEMARAEQT